MTHCTDNSSSFVVGAESLRAIVSLCGDLDWSHITTGRLEELCCPSDMVHPFLPGTAQTTPPAVIFLFEHEQGRCGSKVPSVSEHPFVASLHDQRGHFNGCCRPPGQMAPSFSFRNRDKLLSAATFAASGSSYGRPQELWCQRQEESQFQQHTAELLGQEPDSDRMFVLI